MSDIILSNTILCVINFLLEFHLNNTRSVALITVVDPSSMAKKQMNKLKGFIKKLIIEEYLKEKKNK